MATSNKGVTRQELAVILARLESVEAQLEADKGAEFATIYEVARYLHPGGKVSTKTVRRMTDDGTFKVTKIRGRNFYDMREVRSLFPSHLTTEWTNRDKLPNSVD